MTDGEALLRAVRHNGLELTPKLEFLDWAEENPAWVSESISAALGIVPDLCANGIGFSRIPQARLTAPEEFARERAAMLTEGRAFAACVAWLTCREKRLSVNPDMSSYGYKHRVEDCFGHDVYVANGVFIAAAIHMGFSWKIVPGSLNTLHGISKRSLK